ncbi:MAG TPA: hypothetical protein VFR58_00220, partial [Flavisolibacter sp.]|nr:hypothetical protein [Flavisolibacter sp.]
RTKSTAAPLASALGLAVQPYEPADSGFVERVKKLGKGDVVIVGHSNTVDDLVNTMMGERIIESDLPDSQYGDLFVIIRRGSKYKLEKRHFGK